MLTYDDNQKATKAHCRLAFSAQPQRFFLPLLVGLHGITHATARKLATEEKMFWKVTLPSTELNFSAKDVCSINFTVSFYLYLYLQDRLLEANTVAYFDQSITDYKKSNMGTGKT